MTQASYFHESVFLFVYFKFGFFFSSFVFSKESLKIQNSI